MKIVIADDSALLREGVAGLLTRRGHEVVAQVGDADALPGAVAQHSPDLVITDVRMPPTMRDDGLQAALALREQGPVNVLVLSQYVAPAYARELFSGGDGGTGYLLKDRVAEVKDFVQACETVAAGGVVIDPDVASELMAEGLSNAEIAGKLYFSGAAVAKHVSSIFAKLGLTPDEENRRVRAILMYLSERGIS